MQIVQHQQQGKTMTALAVRGGKDRTGSKLQARSHCKGSIETIGNNYTKELFETDQRKDFNSKTMGVMTTATIMTITKRRRTKEDQEDWVNATKQSEVRLVPQSYTDSKGNGSIRNNNNEYQKEKSTSSDSNNSRTGTMMKKTMTA
jgi:hypothetical protein